jgi:hypothetical protein
LVRGLETNGIKRGEHVWFPFANQHELQKEITIFPVIIWEMQAILKGVSFYPEDQLVLLMM